MKVIINVVGGQVQEVHADTKEIDVVLVDFDQHDDEVLSAQYVETVLENPEMFNIPIREMNTEQIFDDKDARHNADCCVCLRKELINLNATDWMPEIYVGDDSLGPVCPSCQRKWATIPRDEEPFISLSSITLAAMSEVPGLVDYIQQKEKTAKDVRIKQREETTNKNARIVWLRNFYNNMIKVLIDDGALSDMAEASLCFQFHQDLHGEGPAIIKTAGEFEILGVDICVDLDRNRYVSVPEPDNSHFAEPENSECIRCYKAA